ncbi:hypothetical protein HDU81_002352, partial [Chytriomyces hyalinus]
MSTRSAPTPPAKPKALQVAPPLSESGSNEFSAEDAATQIAASGGVKARIAQLRLKEKEKTEFIETKKWNDRGTTTSQPEHTPSVKKHAPPPPPSRKATLAKSESDDSMPPRPSPSQPPSILRKPSLETQHSAHNLSVSTPPPPVRLRNPNNRRSLSLAKPNSTESLSLPSLVRNHAGSAEGHNLYSLNAFPTNHDTVSAAESVLSGASTDTSATSKREKIVREILTTERSYFEDMVVLKEVYVIPAIENKVFPLSDIKLLFGNVDSLIDVSRQMLQALGDVVAEDRIGDAFLQVSHAVEETYTAYCKNNETAMTKLFDYSSPEASETVKQFWKECQANLRDRTNAWDLSSLIIKPVQRVLKYPLLLAEMLKETPEASGHPDHASLLKAFNEYGRIAETINEVKKRKDTVDKYVEGKGGINVMHGISKKLNRTNEKIKHATRAVAEMSRDDEFYVIYEKFNRQHMKMISFSKEILIWVKTLREMLECQEICATSLEEVYMIPGGPSGSASNSNASLDRSTESLGGGGGGGFLGSRSKSAWPSLRKKPNDLGSRLSLSGNALSGHVLTVAEYRRICAKLAYEPWKDAETEIKNSIIPAINTLQSRLKEPLHLIRKRDDKLLDHDRVKRMKAKGEAVDKALQESADAYTSINAELVLQLPKLISLVAEYMDHVLCSFASIQARAHNQVAMSLSELLQHFRVADGDEANVTEEYRNAILQDNELTKRIWDIRILEQWRENVWRNDGGAATGGVEIEECESVVSVGGGSAVGYGSSNAIFSGLFGKGISSRGGSVTNRTTESVRSARTHTESIRTEEYHLTSPPAITYSSETTTFEVVALYTFIPETNDELAFQSGDALLIEAVCGRNGDESNEDWWYGRLEDGNEGWVPSNYVQRRSMRRDHLNAGIVKTERRLISPRVKLFSLSMGIVKKAKRKRGGEDAIWGMSTMTGRPRYGPGHDPGIPLKKETGPTPGPAPASADPTHTTSVPTSVPAHTSNTLSTLSNLSSSKGIAIAAPAHDTNVHPHSLSSYRRAKALLDNLSRSINSNGGNSLSFLASPMLGPNASTASLAKSLSKSLGKSWSREAFL